MAKRSHADTLAQMWDTHVAAEFEGGTTRTPPSPP